MRKQPSRYTEIAIDIATMITNGEIVEGERVSGRSVLASKYNVSPETIRRAVALLKDFGVVDSAPKSGIKVLSTRKALDYIHKNQNRSTINDLKNDINSIIGQKAELDKLLTSKINQMIKQLTTARDTGILYPLEVDLPETSSLVGQTIGNSRFWQNTGATVISIKRQGNACLSPGPDWQFEAFDTIVFIGKRDVYSKVIDFIKK